MYLFSLRRFVLYCTMRCGVKVYICTYIQIKMSVQQFLTGFLNRIYIGNFKKNRNQTNCKMLRYIYKKYFEWSDVSHPYIICLFFLLFIYLYNYILLYLNSRRRPQYPDSPESRQILFLIFISIFHLLPYLTYIIYVAINSIIILLPLLSTQPESFVQRSIFKSLANINIFRIFVFKYLKLYN